MISPTGHLPRLLCTMGMTPLGAPSPANSKDCYNVVLNGQVIGHVENELAKPLADKLRMFKVMKEEKVIMIFIKKPNILSETIEITHVEVKVLGRES